MKKAFITGITGQDGSYLAELLLSKDYKVYGLVRRTSTNNKQRIEHLLSKITLVEGDLLDCSSLYTHLADIQPDEIYNLAAQSHVGTSFTVPQFTFSSIADGTLNLLEAFRSTCPGSKFYQASSSEMFGETMGTIKRLIGEDGTYREVWAQDEKTRMLPQSPYGVAKLAAHHLCRVYRQMGLFICSGLLFNHESPRRGLNFVTRKITNYIGLLENQKTNIKLKLGNLNANRDWGHAKDYVRAMWMMLQHNKADDYVVSTGETHSVKELCDIAFSIVNKNYENCVEIDKDLYRPAEVHYLLGDSSKIRNTLGWTPEYSFKSLIEDMVESDIQLHREHNGTERLSLA